VAARRWSALVPAALAAGLLSGCFGGTVRDSPEESGSQRPGGGEAKGGHKANGSEKAQRSGKRKSSGSVVTLAAVGDTAMGVTPTLPSDPAGYLDPIAGELVGDVVFGNLEGTLTDVSESPKCGPGSTECFAFRAPPEYADHLAAAGFTLMSNANNHSYDFGEAGEDETIEALHSAGIEQTGLPGEITVVKAGGRKVAFLGFAPYSNTASLTDLETARAMIREAREQADVVVVAIHAGAEGSDATHVSGEEEIYLGEDRGNAEEFSHLAVRAGADLVLGSGPHVLRGMEIYRGRLIAYSLGNFSGYHNFTTEGVLGETVVLHVTMAPDGAFRAGRLASVSMIEAGQPVPDPEGRGAALVAELSREDFGASGIGVGPEGRIER
jgi:poly-gamma-glutamate capsule biosynthesis protein CapA/YwtB (metallophosphatase superfamily)